MRTNITSYISMETPISGDVISYPLYIENYQEIKENIPLVRNCISSQKYLHRKMVCNQLLTYL